jgi:Arp2/3 complex, 34 kD subunit p34-Arc
MQIRCWDELVKYGALDVLEREYGSLLAAQPEPEYNVSLEIDLEQIPADTGAFNCSSPVASADVAVKIRGAGCFHHVRCFVQTQCAGGTI